MWLSLQSEQLVKGREKAPLHPPEGMDTPVLLPASLLEDQFRCCLLQEADCLPLHLSSLPLAGSDSPGSLNSFFTVLEELTPPSPLVLQCPCRSSQHHGDGF